MNVFGPVITSSYAGNVQYYSKLAHYHQLTIDVYQHYEKQTLRNRCQIATANGPMDLIIPVSTNSGSKTMDKDVRILNNGWQKLHWGALESAYRHSPFFMYYEDDIRPFYNQEYTFLLDFNIALQDCLLQLIGINPQLVQSSSYVDSPTQVADFRPLVKVKKTIPDAHFNPTPYYQVFEQRHGFLPNLSILDLLFNMGNESILILQQSFIDA